MPEYLAPGVFVEEIDSGSRPIEGVGINTAAFVGYAKSGEFNKPIFISNWTQFCQIFGEEENGLMRGLADEMGLTIAEVRSAKKASRKGWMEFAQTAISTAIRDKKSRLKSWQEFVKNYNIPQSGQPYIEGVYLAHAVRGYYANGGGRAYIVRVASQDDWKALSYVANGRDELSPAQEAHAVVGPLTLKALQAGAVGNNITVRVEHVGEGTDFKLTITDGSTKEEFPFPGGKDAHLNRDNAEQLIAGKSRLVMVEKVAKTKVADARPAAQLYLLEGGVDPAAVLARRQHAAGQELPSDVGPLKVDDFDGDEAARTGTGGLVPVQDINFVCMPDVMAGVWTRKDVPGVDGKGGVAPEELTLDDRRTSTILSWQCALVAHCEQMGDRMAILDPIPGLNPQEMNETVMGMPHGCDHGQAAVYYPWIKVSDPFRKGEKIFVPPSGHIAGVWCRVGSERGVHKAPANEALIGAVALERDITRGEQELLNPNGINCIRAFPGTGIRVWGARTLATVGNPSWKYINVRRLFNYLEKSIERSMQWVVFEPNDQDLWGRVRRNIAAFLWTEWKEGKLFGTVPEESFYVKCDNETNPQEMIDLGRLYVEIGINPVKPAEFVIIRMGQWSSGGSVNEA